MNLEDVLKALKSCGIEPEKYGYGHYGGIQDSYYIKDNKYYHSYPDDFDRPKNVIYEEIESEAEFIRKYLINISMDNRQLSVLTNVLYSLCCDTNKCNLEIYHHNLFEWYKPLWNICKKMNYKDYWKYNIISNAGELFKHIYNYGIGFIDGKYVVERQGPYATGDKPHVEYESFVYDNYCDAFLQLKKYADSDILCRQIAVNKFIQSYKMDKEENEVAQEMCNLLNARFKNSVDRFAINTANANNIVYIRDYGYYSFRINEKQVSGSVHFHCNGKHMPSVIKSFCKTYELDK